MHCTSIFRGAASCLHRIHLGTFPPFDELVLRVGEMEPDPNRTGLSPLDMDIKEGVLAELEEFFLKPTIVGINSGLRGKFAPVELLSETRF